MNKVHLVESAIAAGILLLELPYFLKISLIRTVILFFHQVYYLNSKIQAILASILLVNPQKDLQYIQRIQKLS